MPSIPAALPANEARRLQALVDLDLLDSLPEQAFNDLAELAKAICQVPIALVSLIDTDRQWFKACVGLDASQTPRDEAFCAHAILQPDELMVVENAELDPRFATNPLVLHAPYIRFYAGAPILSPSGHALGTLCVIDQRPRELDAAQRSAMQALARQVAVLLSLRQSQLDREKETLLLSRQVLEALADDLAVHAPLRHGQRIATVGQLASGIAHDFNNSLQGINSTLQLIERRAERVEDVRRLSGLGQRAVEHAAQLVARLQSFSRNQQSDTQRFCIIERVASGCDLYTRLLGPQVQLSLAVCEAPLALELDATQLEAALLNLLVNARDAMNGSGQLTLSIDRVTVSADAQLADGDYVRLSLQDSGPGMSPEVAEQAFEPFFTTKADGEGTGLGLAQVYAFATRSGGIARIHSRPGQGTEVVLWLSTAARDVGVSPT